MLEENQQFVALLDKFRKFDALRDDETWEKRDYVSFRSTPSVEPVYAPDTVFKNLLPEVRTALLGMGISQLYRHQARALHAIDRKLDVVISTPPASGKTLCFNLPITTALIRDPSVRALMIHPMKALAYDQRHQLESLLGRLPNTRGLSTWIFDGDTPEDERRLIKAEPPSVLFTNPEMLHLSLLAYWDQWIAFLKNVRYLVIDEVHEYRGFFGTNVALLLRRFLYKLNELGVNPQLILASATCANPVEHAERLTGRSIELIEASQPMRPPRHFSFVAPSIESHIYQRIYLLRIARAALACQSEGLQAIIFCPTRKFCEEVTKITQREAIERGCDPSEIVPYRSGYTAEHRREIEEGMRNGRNKIIFTTNALEIGIDIGTLDVCILAGFPDSIMSAWQRIGRVGRSWRNNAYVFFYALNNPFDRFMVQNIDLFLSKPLDSLTIGLQNEELIAKHLPCLLHEKTQQIAKQDASILGDRLCEMAIAAEANYKPLARRGTFRPHMAVPIRGLFGGEYALIYQGKEIGTLSEQQKHYEAYLGAIYNHFGKPYKVTSHGTNEIQLEDAEAHRRTEAFIYSTATIVDFYDAFRISETASYNYGKIRIYYNYTGYRIEDEISGAVIDTVQLSTPNAISKTVHSIWISLENKAYFQDKLPALSLLEQMLRLAVAFVVPCDRYDVGSILQRDTPPTIYVHENVPGGIGIAQTMQSIYERVIDQGIRIAEQCGCEYGCPKCINPSRRNRDESKVPKALAIGLAEELKRLIHFSEREIYDSHTGGWRKQ